MPLLLVLFHGCREKPQLRLSEIKLLFTEYEYDRAVLYDKSVNIALFYLHIHAIKDFVPAVPFCYIVKFYRF